MAPPLGTVSGLPQRRNRCSLGYPFSFGRGLLGSVGRSRAGFHKLEHCPSLGRDLPAGADAFDQPLLPDVEIRELRDERASPAELVAYASNNCIGLER